MSHPFLDAEAAKGQLSIGYGKNSWLIGVFHPVLKNSS